MLVENVSRLCKERNTTIFSLERELGIGNGTIGKWKGRARSPRLETVKRIADYFGVTVDELLSDQPIQAVDRPSA